MVDWKVEMTAEKRAVMKDWQMVARLVEMRVG